MIWLQYSMEVEAEMPGMERQPLKYDIQIN